MRFYAAEVLLALEYLHAMGFVYRDLKPENILLHESGHIRLTDFDLSKASVTPVNAHVVQSMMGTGPTLVAEPSLVTNSFVGTLEYLAPEVIVGRGYGASVDWWTFGILMYEMLYGHPPFQGRNQDDTFAQIKKSSLKFPDHARGPVSKECKSLIKKLLTHDPKKRLGSEQGAAEIKAHPFFKDINLQLILNSKPPIIPDLSGPKDYKYFSNKLVDDDPDNEDLEAIEPGQLGADHPFKDFVPYDRDADMHAKATGGKGASKPFKKSSTGSSTPQKSGSSSNLKSTKGTPKPESKHAHERSEEDDDDSSNRTASSNDSPNSDGEEPVSTSSKHKSSRHRHDSDSEDSKEKVPVKRKKSPAPQLSASGTNIKRSTGSAPHADSDTESSEEHAHVVAPKPTKVARSKTPVPDEGDYPTTTSRTKSKHLSSSSANVTPDPDHPAEEKKLKKSSLAVPDPDADSSSHRKKSHDGEKSLKKNTSNLSEELDAVHLSSSGSVSKKKSSSHAAPDDDTPSRSSSRKGTPTTSKRHSTTSKSPQPEEGKETSDSDEKPASKPKKSKFITKPGEADDSS